MTAAHDGCWWCRALPGEQHTENCDAILAMRPLNCHECLGYGGKDGVPCKHCGRPPEAHMKRDARSVDWLFFDEFGQRWRLRPTGDQSMPLVITLEQKR